MFQISKNYATCLQYHLKYETVRTEMVYIFIVFYSLFSLHSLHFFFSLLSHQFRLSSPCTGYYLYTRLLGSSTNSGCSPAATTAQLRRRQHASPARAWRIASWKRANSEWFVCGTHWFPLSYLCSSHRFLSIFLTL